MTFRISLCTFQTSHPKQKKKRGEGDTYAQWCHHDQELCVEGSGMSHGAKLKVLGPWEPGGFSMVLKMKGRYIDW